MVHTLRFGVPATTVTIVTIPILVEGNPAVAGEWRLKPGAPRKVSAFLERAEGKWELG